MQKHLLKSQDYKQRFCLTKVKISIESPQWVLSWALKTYTAGPQIMSLCFNIDEMHRNLTLVQIN